jgi:hypothetical protein
VKNDRQAYIAEHPPACQREVGLVGKADRWMCMHEIIACPLYGSSSEMSRWKIISTNNLWKV